MAISERHDETVTPDDVRSCDIPWRTFYDHAKRLRWTQVHPRVWSPPGAADTYERQMTAAQRAVGESGVLTGESVLWLYGCLRQRPQQVHILLPPRHHHAALQGLRFFRGRWVTGDAAERKGRYETAPLLRALTDVAAIHSERALTSDVVALDRLRLASPADIAAYLSRRGRFPGNVRLQAVLMQLGIEMTHSGIERLARRALREIGLRPAPRPFAVVEDGIHLAEIDIAFPPLLYGAEVDGPHHLLPEVAQADKVRDRGLEQRNWRIDRFTVEEIERSPAAVAVQVRQGVVAAATRLGLPVEDPRWMVTTGE